MVELGDCIGRRKNLQYFLVKDYFTCGHVTCYSLAIKFLCCIKRGNRTCRYFFDRHQRNVVTGHTILPTTYDCYCIKCKVLAHVGKWYGDIFHGLGNVICLDPNMRPIWRDYTFPELPFFKS